MVVLSISLVIPTFGRERVLLETISMLLQQDPSAAEILVVDQTECHEPPTENQLAAWHRDGHIRWIRLHKPSQPAALNVAIQKSTQPFVLFLDDDIRMDTGFVKTHFDAFESDDIWAVAGQVLQPGEKEDITYMHSPQSGLLADADFIFRSAKKCFIQNGMSGNLCVRRARALELGGFDENFSPPVAYRFDNDFCKRLVQAGGHILFEPKARIYHLRAQRGGTRHSGSHLTSGSPKHGVGDYYFALRCAKGWEALFYIFKRPFREVRTKFHLTHPWYIPVKFIGELRAIRLAIRLYREGPRLVKSDGEK